jgi:hypothetical protein
MWYRNHKYLRLDGSSKLSDRRDMVEDYQTKPEIFIFLLSTRAGGLGINLTAADTVIFYDSDWNPTMDEQVSIILLFLISKAMDRAHRLGQTRQVTVYRLITKSTIEERILKRAKQKHAVSGLSFSVNTCRYNHWSLLVGNFNKTRRLLHKRWYLGCWMTMKWKKKVILFVVGLIPSVKHFDQSKAPKKKGRKPGSKTKSIKKF